MDPRARVRARPPPSTGASVRSLVRVSASGECGKVQNSKWSWASARSSSVASTSSSGSVASTPRSRNAGTQRSVTAVTIPSEPSPIRAARSRSPSSPVSVRRSPVPSTSSSASTWALRFCSREPVPCVPVASAPASVWASMSPRLGIARPSSSSPRLSAASVIPASALTRPLARSASRIRSSRPRSTSVPSVGTHGENEWPEPAARTVRPAAAARRIAPATSRADFGRSIATGSQRWVPAQLLHMPRTLSPSLRSRCRSISLARCSTPRGSPTSRSAAARPPEGPRQRRRPTVSSPSSARPATRRSGR